MALVIFLTWSVSSCMVLRLPFQFTLTCYTSKILILALRHHNHHNKSTCKHYFIWKRSGCLKYFPSSKGDLRAEEISSFHWCSAFSSKNFKVVNVVSVVCFLFLHFFPSFNIAEWKGSCCLVFSLSLSYFMKHFQS